MKTIHKMSIFMMLSIFLLAGVTCATCPCAAETNETLNENDLMLISEECQNESDINITSEILPPPTIAEEVSYIRNVSEEKFTHNSRGNMQIFHEGDLYELNCTLYNAQYSYCGSKGDVHEEVLIVGYTNNWIRAFNLTTGEEIKSKNNLPWSYSAGNVYCMTNHYTNMPSSGGGEKIEDDPKGKPDEIVYSTSVSDNFAIMQEIWATQTNVVIKVAQKGTWDANTVKELREQYPTKKIIILEWCEE